MLPLLLLKFKELFDLGEATERAGGGGGDMGGVEAADNNVRSM
jgi:hypothetical protein